MFILFYFIIFLKIWSMISNLKLVPHINILQKKFQNVQKPKKYSILSLGILDSRAVWLPHRTGFSLHDVAPKSVLFKDIKCYMSTQDRGFFLFQLRTKVFFCFCTFWTEFCEILKFRINLKLEIIDYIFRKIITLNEVNILESPNEYYQKQV